jgi:hypothetical protein
MEHPEEQLRPPGCDVNSQERTCGGSPLRPPACAMKPSKHPGPPHPSGTHNTLCSHL